MYFDCKSLHLASTETIEELVKTIQKNKFNKSFEGREEKRKGLVIDYTDLVTVVIITQVSTDCRDPKDNKFLSLALSGGADFIISGDKDLTVLNPYHGVRILTMREYADEVGIIL